MRNISIALKTGSASGLGWAKREGVRRSCEWAVKIVIDQTALKIRLKLRIFTKL